MNVYFSAKGCCGEIREPRPFRVQRFVQVMYVSFVICCGKTRNGWLETHGGSVLRLTRASPTQV